ncbi:MAG: Crp/Fnr family transcriptional regulator [Chloroflexi bacterium]|nr:Crp/Fnr family transcriptional regulator [Chloroflexota bacterium]
MISPELLRRFPFFGFLDEPQLKAVAMLSEEMEVEKDANIFETDQSAEALYVMVEGSIDLNYKVVDRDDPKIVKEFFISELNPGDIFGLSALLEPFKHTMTAKVLTPSRVIRIEARGLRALSELDAKLQAGLMKATAMAAMERLHDTRIQLAAARA